MTTDHRLQPLDRSEDWAGPTVAAVWVAAGLGAVLVVTGHAGPLTNLLDDHRSGAAVAAAVLLTVGTLLALHAWITAGQCATDRYVATHQHLYPQPPADGAAPAAWATASQQNPEHQPWGGE
jgi:protein-S-isoprenylcysteine O-methyltransferase Ste14